MAFVMEFRLFLKKWFDMPLWEAGELALGNNQAVKKKI